MSGREVFGAAIRVLGVWFFYNAAADTVWLFLRLQHVVTEPTTTYGLPSLFADYHVTSDKLFVGLNLAFAVVLIGFANGIVRLCYGPKTKDRS